MLLGIEIYLFLVRLFDIVTDTYTYRQDIYSDSDVQKYGNIGSVGFLLQQTKVNTR